MNTYQKETKEQKKTMALNTSVCSNYLSFHQGWPNAQEQKTYICNMKAINNKCNYPEK